MGRGWPTASRPWTLRAGARRTATMPADGGTNDPCRWDDPIESEYNANGRVIERRDEAGRVTAFEYDALGRLAAVIDAAGGRTVVPPRRGRESHAPDGRAQPRHRYGYDALNRLAERILPSGAFETFTYDAVGNPIAHRDFNGASTIHEYDEVNRLTRRRFPDSSDVTFTYIPTGPRATSTDARGMTRYEYDARDRLVRVTHPNGAIVNSTYDANGQLERLSSPAGWWTTNTMP